MKILLLGDFSSLHKNLKEGLVELGHEVHVASSGDGWKKISSDYNIGRSKKGIFGSIEKAVNLVNVVPKLSGYDIVQFISPVIFPMNFGLNKKIVDFIFRNNGKIFLVGAGATNHNSYIADFLQHGYKNPQLYQAILSSYGGSLWSQGNQGREYNEYFHGKINGYIPIMYEYAQGYRNIDHEKLTNTIPIPIDIRKTVYEKNYAKDKVVFFHGLNREADKGTSLIRSAMENLKQRYPKDVDIVLDGRMPLDQYLNFLKCVNCVVDQAYALSYGVNAVFNMALGRIVIGGGHVECLEEFSLKKSPMIPIEPSVKDIVVKLEGLLDSRSRFEELGYNSRLYVEKNHESIMIAKSYLQTWDSK